MHEVSFNKPWLWSKAQPVDHLINSGFCFLFPREPSAFREFFQSLSLAAVPHLFFFSAPLLSRAPPFSLTPAAGGRSLQTNEHPFLSNLLYPWLPHRKFAPLQPRGLIWAHLLVPVWGCPTGHRYAWACVPPGWLAMFRAVIYDG